MHSLDNWCNHVVILYTPVSHPILQPVSSLCGYIEHITAKRGNLIITGSSYSLVNALSNVQILQTWFDLDLWPFKLKLHYIREKKIKQKWNRNVIPHNSAQLSVKHSSIGRKINTEARNWAWNMARNVPVKFCLWFLSKEKVT